MLATVPWVLHRLNQQVRIRHACILAGKVITAADSGNLPGPFAYGYAITTEAVSGDLSTDHNEAVQHSGSDELTKIKHQW